MWISNSPWILSREGMETYKASPVTNTQNDTKVVSKYYPVLVGRGDGIRQGRAHARGASTPVHFGLMISVSPWKPTKRV